MVFRIYLKKIFVCFTALTLAASVFALAAKKNGVQCAENAAKCVRVPVIMYHSVCVNRKANSNYIVSPEVFRADTEALLKAGFTFVSLGELYDFYTGKGRLPEKPIALTFDDGFLNNLTAVLPVLEELGIKANVNVVGSFTQRYSELCDRSASYACLTWDDIKTLASGGLVEIGSHTWDMHSYGTRKGCSKKRGETPEEYKQVFREDIRRLNTALQENCGITPFVFAYPYGAISSEAEEVLVSEGFRVLLTCEEKVNVIQKGGSGVLKLGRFNRSAAYSTEKFISML